MSVKCYELVDSMSGSVTNESEGGEIREVKRRYVIGRCTGGFNQAVSEIAQYAPPYVNGDGNGLYWVRKRLDVNGIGNAYFDCTAHYQTLQPKVESSEGDGNFTPGAVAWDTTGNTEHITQGLKPEVRIPANAPNFQGAINVSGDSVQGLDVVRPNLRYSETWILPVQLAVSCEFIGAVYKLTGTVNLNEFRCFDPGEALFMGARAQWQGDQPYVSVTFDWECRPNGDVNMPLVPGIFEYVPGGGGGGVGGAMDKLGWEHIWIMYQPESAGGALIRKPIAVYKNVVYRQESWASLGMITSAISSPISGANGQAVAGGGNGPA